MSKTNSCTILVNNIVTECNDSLTNQVIRAILCTWLREEPLGEPLNQHLDNLIHHVTAKSVSVLGH